MHDWLTRLRMYFFGRAALGIRCVLISDTHGSHRQLSIPPGDVLIHAGDFTRMGLQDDVEDFNVWLGEQPHAHKVVIFGNHEHNAPWVADAANLLSNATLLRDTSVALDVVTAEGTRQLYVHGTNFCWPMRSRNPEYDQITGPVDVLVAHGPAMGYADGGKGCSELLRLAHRLQPRLMVGGHIHYAHGISRGRTPSLAATTFVNAANARLSHTEMGWAPEVVVI